MTIIASNVSSSLSKIYYSAIASPVEWSNEKSIDHINKLSNHHYRTNTTFDFLFKPFESQKRYNCNLESIEKITDFKKLV